jgi:hypothetical protein
MMFWTNLKRATGFMLVVFLIYKGTALLHIPLYPYGFVLFIFPLLAIVPLYQYFQFKQISGYKRQLLLTGFYTQEALDSMSEQELLLRSRYSAQHPGENSAMLSFQDLLKD